MSELLGFNSDVFSPMTAPKSSKIIEFIKILQNSRQSSESRSLGNFIIIQFGISTVFLVLGVTRINFDFISESCHTLLHVTAFIFSLYACIIGKQKNDYDFTFGYNRYETISAFSNCIFMILSSLFLLMSSFHSIHHIEKQLKEFENHATIINIYYVQFIFNIIGCFSFSEYALFIPLKKFNEINIFGGVTPIQKQKFFNDYENIFQKAKNFGYIDGQQQKLLFSSHFENMHSVFLLFLVDILLNFSKIMDYHFDQSITGTIFVLCLSIFLTTQIFTVCGKILLQGIPIDNPQQIQDVLNKIQHIDEKHFWCLTTGFTVANVKIEANLNVRKQVKQILYTYFQEVYLEIIQ